MICEVAVGPKLIHILDAMAGPCKLKLMIISDLGDFEICRGKRCRNLSGQIPQVYLESSHLSLSLEDPWAKCFMHVQPHFQRGLLPRPFDCHHKYVHLSKTHQISLTPKNVKLWTSDRMPQNSIAFWTTPPGRTSTTCPCLDSAPCRNSQQPLQQDAMAMAFSEKKTAGFGSADWWENSKAGICLWIWCLPLNDLYGSHLSVGKWWLHAISVIHETNSTTCFQRTKMRMNELWSLTGYPLEEFGKPRSSPIFTFGTARANGIGSWHSPQAWLPSNLLTHNIHNSIDPRSNV